MKWRTVDNERQTVTRHQEYTGKEQKQTLRDVTSKKEWQARARARQAPSPAVELSGRAGSMPTPEGIYL